MNELANAAPYEEVSKTLVTTWYSVAQGSVEKLKEHADRTLFLCWPPYTDVMATNVLNAYQGNRFVSIGEDYGGCTGDDAFFALLRDRWEEVADHPIKQWKGIHDWMRVFQRKHSKECGDIAFPFARS